MSRQNQPFPSQRAIRRAVDRDKKAQVARRAYCDIAEGACRMFAAGAALSPDAVPGLFRSLADGVRVYGVTGDAIEAIGMVAQSNGLGVSLFSSLLSDACRSNPPAAPPTTPPDAPTVDDNGNPSPYASPHPSVTRVTRKRNRARS